MLREAYARLTNAIQDEVTQAGFSSFRAVFGNVIPFVPEEGITVSAIALHLGQTKQSIAQVVDDLERLGYVERRAHPTDGRSRLVFLTEKGAGVRPIARVAGGRIEDQWERVVGPARLEEMRQILRDLLDGLEALDNAQDI